MQVRPEQLAGRLEKGLAPVYLVSGDEPLQLLEAADAIRGAARAAGYSEREVFDVDARFDWQRVAASASSLSLFGDHRLVELRLPSGKPGQEGAKVLSAWCGDPPSDTVLLIACGRLEPAQRRAAWVRAADAAGVWVQVWPVNASDLPRWIDARLRAAGLSATPEALALLAERGEGNLLAVRQEIDKLRLLRGGGSLGADDVSEAVADSARHDVFDLATAAFLGDPARVVRVARRLEQEGAEPTLALWALAGGTRAAARIRGGGSTPRDALRGNRLFGNLARAVEQAAGRGSARRWERLLVHCARVDRAIKGAGPGSAWAELLDLGIAIAGVSPPGMRRAPGDRSSS